MHRRDRACAEQAPFALLHVVGAPVVVGACLGLGEVDVGLALEAEEHRGIQHREVDVVLVHVLETRLGVPGRGARLRVAHLAAERSRPVFVAHARHSRRGHGVGRRPAVVVQQPLLTRLVGLDVPDSVAILGGRVLRHRRRMLEDVAVGIDVAQALVSRHHVPFAQSLPQSPIRQQSHWSARRPFGVQTDDARTAATTPQRAGISRSTVRRAAARSRSS